MTRPKRKYVLLSSAAWAEVRAFWETGDHDLAELSDRYGVSRRAIQSHLAKLGSVKGARAAEMAAVVRESIFKDELGDPNTLVVRARETRETTYANAKIIEDLVMAQLEIAQKDPTQAFKSSTALKALSLAASALERLHATKSRALGLDKESALPDELPVLTFRDLSQEELTALHNRDEADEDDELGGPIAAASIASTGSEIDDSDDFVVEGGEVDGDDIIEEGREPAAPVKPRPALFDCPGGGRLVKGALP